MLNFKPLTIDDKNIFDRYLESYNYGTSEYSFTNLFIWRKAYDIQYAIFNDALIIKKTNFNGSCYFIQPIGYKKENLKNIVDTLIENKNKNKFKFGYLFKNIEEGFIKDLLDIYGDEYFTILEDRDNADYIYESKNLISLSGKKLHKKKNNYNHFVKNYNYETSSITLELIQPCIRSAHKWFHKHIDKGYPLYELEAIEELLKNYSVLNFKGMVVFVDGKISAFTMGEKVNEDMAIIHIEKADSDIRGLYNFINKDFVEAYFSDVTYINREQDLGIEGLRSAKKSYVPIKLAKKFIIQ